MARGGDTWCILRTRGGSTLRLAESLNDSGIQAWTPIGVRTKREGRARDRVETPAPILPTFVFVRSDHIGELVRICGLLVSQHPAFSIFRYLGAIHLISDRDMAFIREAEEQAGVALKRKQRFDIPNNSSVRFTEGAFAGLSGVVEDCDGKRVLVAFGGNFKVTISAWLLPQDLLEASVSNQDTAAQAA